MADLEWEEFGSNEKEDHRERSGGRGSTNGRGFNRNKNESQGGDSWLVDTDTNGDFNSGRGGMSRGRGGRGRGSGRGGGGKFSDNNGNRGDFVEDQPPPVNDKPRPTYIPPEIDDNDFIGCEVGMNFNKYEKIEVNVSGDSVPKHIESFKNSGLREVLVEKLAKCNYTTPTPIQKYAIPIIIDGRDMMASAQTGSGKTVSFINDSIEFE